MKDTYSRNIIKTGLHIFAWTMIMVLPYLINRQWSVGARFLKFYYATNIITASIFYINYFFLFPRFYLSNQRRKYFVSVILLIIIFYYISGYLTMTVFKSLNIIPLANSQVEVAGPGEESYKRAWFRFRAWDFNMPRSLKQMQIFNYVITATSLIFLSGGLRALERQSGIDRLQKDLEREKLNSELAFLKNQISPHFFFNTLNNIYSLVEVNAEDSRKAILQLSRLMRYLLYESQGETKLSREIDFMKDFVDLMKLRMTEKIRLNVSFPDITDDIIIPPLIFIPFIENAFKHGISYREKSYININIGVEKNELHFLCTNSKATNTLSEKKKGIGLENVQKRLQLLFPGRHALSIEETDTDYYVDLKITLPDA